MQINTANCVSANVAVIKAALKAAKVHCKRNVQTTYSKRKQKHTYKFKALCNANNAITIRKLNAIAFKYNNVYITISYSGIYTLNVTY